MDGRLALAFTEHLRDWQDFEPAKQFCHEMIKDALLAADEIDRLRAEKRRALAVADERAIEANGVRAENERLREENAALTEGLRAYWGNLFDSRLKYVLETRKRLAAEQTGDGK